MEYAVQVSLVHSGRLSIRPAYLFTVQSLLTHSLVRTAIRADPPLESTLETPHDHREFIMETDNIHMLN